MADAAPPPVDASSPRAAILTMLAARSGTLCPSEVARALAPDEWRDHMPMVHAAVDTLLGEGAIRLSWKGTALPTRQGPYRIVRPER